MKQIADHLLELIIGFQNYLDRFSLLIIKNAEGTGIQQLQIAFHVIERCKKFVGQVGNDTGFGLVQFFQFLCNFELAVRSLTRSSNF